MNEKEYNEILIKSYIEDKNFLIHLDFRKLEKKTNKLKDIIGSIIFFSLFSLLILIRKIKGVE